MSFEGSFESAFVKIFYHFAVKNTQFPVTSSYFLPIGFNCDFKHFLSLLLSFFFNQNIVNAPTFYLYLYLSIAVDNVL